MGKQARLKKERREQRQANELPADQRGHRVKLPGGTIADAAVIKKKWEEAHAAGVLDKEKEKETDRVSVNELQLTNKKTGLEISDELSDRMQAYAKQYILDYQTSARIEYMKANNGAEPPHAIVPSTDRVLNAVLKKFPVVKISKKK